MDTKAIGKRLKELRGKRTQTEIAEFLGVSQSCYCQYESGDRIPRDPMKIKIAKLYQTTVDAIFFTSEYHSK